MLQLTDNNIIYNYIIIYQKLINMDIGTDKSNVKKLEILNRLKIASMVAKLELTNKAHSVPHVLEIKNESNTCIVVKEYIYPGSDDVYFLIYKNADSEDSPIIKIPKNKLQSIYFSNLHDCRVFIRCKIVRVFFHKCTSSQIALRCPVVGMAEFYECKNISLQIRLPECPIDHPRSMKLGFNNDNNKDSTQLPLLTRVENCDKFDIFQSNESLIYIIKGCKNISGTIIDYNTKERLDKYNLSDNMWNYGVQRIICLSRDNGFGAASMEYNLNNIEQLMYLEPKNTPVDNNDLMMLGTTPPVSTPMFDIQKLMRDYANNS